MLLHSCFKEGLAFSPKLWLDPKQDLDPELSETTLNLINNNSRPESAK